MKKILTVLMMVLMMAGLFAYEPKKECAKVKRNGDVVYYEKTDLYNIYGFEPDPKDLCRWYNMYDGSTYDYVKWIIRKGYTVEQFVDYEYEKLESLRDSYVRFMFDANHPDVSNACIAFADCINKINGTNITPEEYESQSAIRCAEQKKRTIILSIPFATEENYLTLTKEEMYKKINDFIEEVKASK